MMEKKQRKMEEKKVSTCDRIVKDRLVFSYLFCLLGILIILIGILCAAYELPQKMLDTQFRKTLTLSPDSPIYPDWVNPSVPIYMKFYLFNVTNGDEVIAGGKPHLQELGPYVYRMYTPKFNVTFHDNATVSFYNNHTLIFQPDLSKGTENDTVSHLNVPLASLGIMIKKMPSVLTYFGLMERMVNMAGGQHLFTQHTANEVIFGHRDPIFSMLSTLLSFTGQVIDPIFGFFHKFNNSHDGSYLLYTGEQDYRRAHKISKWNGQKYQNNWSSKYANMINGTDGSFLGFNISPNDKLYIYFPQMFRSMKLEYERDSEVKNIKTLQFHFSDDFLENATLCPGNEGFCVPSGNCFDSGVLNVQSFMDGAPGIISLPHFYKAAAKYQDSVLGLTPNKEKHDSFFHVEPMSGAVLLGKRRLQINILLHPSDDFEQLKLVRKTIFPVMWLNGVAEVGDKTANDLQTVMGIVKFMGVASYLIVGTGCMIIFSVLLCHLRDYCSKYIRGYVPAVIRENGIKIEATEDKETSL